MRPRAWLRERGARWFYVLAPALDQNSLDEKLDGARYRARMQFYGGEDPATGSAAGCAIAYLVARGADASAIAVHVRQGVEMGRPSDLFLSARKNLRRSWMCALRAAQFLLQKDSFPARDAHAFNRYSSSQVTLCLAAFTGFSTCFHADFQLRLRFSFSLFSRCAVTRTVSDS